MSQLLSKKEDMKDFWELDKTYRRAAEGDWDVRERVAAAEALENYVDNLRTQLATATTERDAALEETAKLFEEVVPMCCESPHPGCAFCIQASHDAPMCCAHPEGDFRWKDGPEIAATIRAFAKTRRAAIDAAREGF